MVKTLAGMIGLMLSIALAPASRANIMDTLGHATWQGATICNDEPVHMTVSVDVPIDVRRANVRVDLRSSPSDPPFARGFGTMTYDAQYGAYERFATMVLNQNSFAFRPSDLTNAGRPGIFDGQYVLSEDSLTLAKAYAPHLTAEQRNPGACPEPTLTRLPSDFTTGGIASAIDLPRDFVGTYGCYGAAQTYRVEVRLDPLSEQEVEGLVAIRDVAGQNEPGAFDVFGEFDAQTGALNLIGDRWVAPVPYETNAFDMFLRLGENGQRLIGTTGANTCGIVDLSVPGTNAADSIVRPLRTEDLLAWDTPEACVAFALWYRQVMDENGIADPYYTNPGWDFRPGLFAEERFVPFFGRTFGELSSADRTHLAGLSRACTRQGQFSDSIAGADAVISRLFPDTASGQWTDFTRFRLLRNRLGAEMAELEDRSVGEADLPELEATLAGLGERFSDLWPSDRAEAEALLNTKIDAALGGLADRLSTEIDALPTELSSFSHETAIRTQIARLGDRREADRLRLTDRLGERLAAIADALYSRIAEHYENVEPDIASLSRLSRAVDRLWQDAGLHAPRSGAGIDAISGVLAGFSEAVLPAFVAQATSMIDPEAEFEDREFQFAGATNLAIRLLPASPQFESLFLEYFDVLARLRPTPRPDDLVRDDGSPTNYGAKLAISDWMETQTAMMDALMPFGNFMSSMMRVSGVENTTCSAAEEAGYWCDLDLRLASPWVPFLAAAGGLPERFRFNRRGIGWAVVETQASRSSGGGGPPYALDTSANDRIQEIALDAMWP